MLWCTVDLRTLVCHLYREKDDLVQRLNDIYYTIENTDPLIDRVKLKLQWFREKETSIERIEKHIANLQRLLKEPRLPEMCDQNRKFTDVSPLNGQPNQRLNKQLLELTLSAIEEGFVRETSYSEKGEFYHPFNTWEV